MAKINHEEQNKIKEIFDAKLDNNVNIVFFSKDEGCEYCEDTKEILEEVSSLDDRISLKTFSLEDEEAKKLGVERAPATIFVDEAGNDLNVHFYGIPSGYEFNTLIEDIVEISNGSPNLMPEVVERVKKIDSDVLLQVFVTPTCPYCPRAVRVAHQFAMVNPHVRAEMVESMEFRELAEEYNVSGVPKTVINRGKAEQVGSVPADTLLDNIESII